jgi:hypothetical protein
MSCTLKTLNKVMHYFLAFLGKASSQIGELFSV